MAELKDRIVLGDFHVASEEWGKTERAGWYHRLKLSGFELNQAVRALQVDVPLEHLKDARDALSVRVVLEVLARREPTDKERIEELERRVKELEGRIVTGDRVRIRGNLGLSWGGCLATVEEIHSAPTPYGLRIDGLPRTEGLKWYLADELEKT